LGTSELFGRVVAYGVSSGEEMVPINSKQLWVNATSIGGSRFERDDPVSKSNVERHSDFVSSKPSYLYSPEQVDKWLNCSGLRFYLEASHPMLIAPVPSKRPIHTPMWVKYEGEWRMIEGRQWLVQGVEVIDVKANEVYLSRRSMYPAPKGYRWRPMGWGAHMVTYSTGIPDTQWDLAQLPNGASYQSILVPEVIRKVSLEEGSIVSKDEGLPLFESSGSWSEKDTGDTEVWMDSHKRVFTERDATILSALDLEAQSIVRIYAWRNDFGVFFNYADLAP